MVIVRKSAIPAVTGQTQELQAILAPLKESVETITGARSGVSPIKKLQVGVAAGAKPIVGSTDIINKINELIVRLNVTGTAENDLTVVGDLALANPSPVLTGVPLAPTAANNTNTTQLATTAFVQAKSRIAPTMQSFNSGSGTYTTPANVTHIQVVAVGGGGGATGGGAGGGGGGAGSNTTFGSSLLTANGGSASFPPGNYPPSGQGGTVSAPAIGYAAIGGNGEYGRASLDSAGGPGGGSALFGGGSSTAAGAAGTAGTANTGAGGGGGAGVSNSTTGGNGGAAAGSLVAWIANPSATYAYAVGAGGAGGTAGTSAFAGGAGGSGRIVVIEFY